PSAHDSRARLVHLNIENLSALRDLPGLDRIVVIGGSRAPHFPQLAIARLDKASAVCGAALQNNRRTVPHPIDIESRDAFIQYWGLKPVRLPVLASIKGHIDRFDLATAGPCQAADVVETLAHQRLAARG